MPDSSGGTDWGPVSSWVAAGVTLAAVMVALFGWRVVDWWRKPTLCLSFDRSEPFCRATKLATGRDGFWVRVLVADNGKDGARGCIGKFASVRSGGIERTDRDPFQLRWCGVPDERGFDGLHLARGQSEYLNVFLIIRGVDALTFVTFPGYAPGFSTALEPNQDHLLRIVAAADNASPKDIWLQVRYSGVFDQLPDSLAILAVEKP